MGDPLRRGLRLATVAIAIVHLFVLALPPLLANASVYRSYAVQIIAYLLVAFVLVSTGHAVWRDRAPNRPLLSGILCVAAVAALVAIPPPYLLEKAEWTFTVVCWTGMLLLLDKGFLAVLVFLAAHLALRLGLLAATGVGDRDAVASALLFSAGFLAYQLGITFADTLLRRMAITVAVAAKLEERLRTAQAVAEHLHRDRRERYASLDTVPLLTGLAAGLLDPADEQVRTRCAVEAGRMRRLFAEQDEVADPLLHELRACVDAAERRGVTVYLGSCGRRPEVPLRVRRALTEPVLAVLATARSYTRVTVVGSPESVTVHAVADGGRPEPPRSREVAVSTLTMEGRHWVEATWQA